MSKKAIVFMFVLELVLFVAAVGIFYYTNECYKNYGCVEGFTNPFPWFDCNYSTWYLSGIAAVFLIIHFLTSYLANKSISTSQDLNSKSITSLSRGWDGDTQTSQPSGHDYGKLPWEK
jgi:hypothetical protein